MILRSRNCKNLIPRWFWFTLVGIPLGLMVWWFLHWFLMPSDKRTSAVMIDAPRSEVKRLPIIKDDFQTLKGIGPKSAAALYQAGVYTFEQLGLINQAKLEGILKDFNLPVSKAEFWQKQAVLAAAEDWSQLEKIQK